MSNNELKGQQVNSTIYIPNSLLNGGGFTMTSKVDYKLSEVDYKDLQSLPRICDWISTGLAVWGVGLIIQTAGRYLAKELNYDAITEPYEIFGGVICLIIAFIVWFIGCFLPNPRKRLLKKIGQHFDNQKPIEQVISPNSKEI